ncbi:MAG: Ig-like domain-containing protein [Bacteroidales bacterium]|nr:Ig-like domain-containing protein [Bacteroidales bacterium]
MKKIILFFITALLILYSQPAFCQTSVLRLPDENIDYSNSIEIPVIADNLLDNLNIVSFQLKLNYDSDIITPAAIITNGTLLSNFGSVEFNFREKNYIYLSVAGTKTLKGKGTLLIIKFNIKKSGYSPVRFYSDWEGNIIGSFINEGTSWGSLQDGSVNINPLPVITVTPDEALVLKGEKLQFDVSGAVEPYTWKTTDNSVATINSSGLLTALKPGKIKVICIDSKFATDTSDIIEVRPLRLEIPEDLQQQQGQILEIPVNISSLTGLGIVSGSFTFYYCCSDWLKFIDFNKTATLLAQGYTINIKDDKNGRLKIAFFGSSALSGTGTLLKLQFLVINSGSSQIRTENAVFNEDIPAINAAVFANTTYNPSLSVTPDIAALFDGETLQFTAEGGTPPYIWEVSDNNIASLSQDGLLTAISGGSVVVTVKDAAGFTAASGKINIYDTYINMADAFALPDTHLEYPVFIGKTLAGKKVYSAQFSFSYNPDELEFFDIITTGTLSQGWALAKNTAPGQLVIAVSGTTPFDIAGIFFILDFKLNASLEVGNTILLRLDHFLLNEGDPFAKLEGYGNINISDGKIFSISGQVKYNHSDSTLLDNIQIKLLDEKDNLIETAITDASGYYNFTKLANGIYKMDISTSRPSKGITPIDALFVNRHYLKIITLKDNLVKKAADITNDNNITPIDALFINRRFLGIIKKFPKPDWVFDNSNIIIADKDVVLKIRAMCTGDVNGSYKAK